MHIYICVGDHLNTLINKERTSERLYKYIEWKKIKNEILSLVNRRLSHLLTHRQEEKIMRNIDRNLFILMTIIMQIQFLFVSDFS